jgi:hypothetical protein
MARLVMILTWWMAVSTVAWAQESSMPSMPAPGALSQWLLRENRYDFGDYTSQTLTAKAWQALGQGDGKAVEAYTGLCIGLYETDAKAQQARLKTWPTPERMGEAWALNDVATAFFIWGESLREQQRDPEATLVFQRILKDFPLAQCWDPKGWYWSVAEGARVRLSVLP